MAGVIELTVLECAELDRLTRKQMTLFKALHPCADVDRLYVTHKKGGKGLVSVADVVSLKKHSLLVYVTNLSLYNQVLRIIRNAVKIAA